MQVCAHIIPENSILNIGDSPIFIRCFEKMCADSDENQVSNTPAPDILQDGNARVVRDQLRRTIMEGHTTPPPAVNDTDAAIISPQTGPTAPDDDDGSDDGDDLPDTDAIRRRLEDEGADRKIREQLAHAANWEEEQDAIRQERIRQRKEIEREIEAESRRESSRRWKRNAGIGAGILVIIVVAAFLSFSVQPNLVADTDSFPYQSYYTVRIPQAESVDFAGVPVTVSGAGDKVIVSISGGLGTEVRVGETVTLSSPRRMAIRIFGISLFETDYQVLATFRGYVPATRQNEFAVSVATSRPIPEWAVGVIMPDGVDVTPVSSAGQ